MIERRFTVTIATDSVANKKNGMIKLDTENILISCLLFRVLVMLCYSKPAERITFDKFENKSV